MPKSVLMVLAVSLLAQGWPSGNKGMTSWPMWGGSPDRNMVSDATGLPTTAYRSVMLLVGPARRSGS